MSRSIPWLPRASDSRPISLHQDKCQSNFLPMPNCSLLGTLLSSHGKLHPSPMRVERAMLEYLQYMPLVTLFQYAFERLKCELNILSEKAKPPSLATVFILPWHTSQKPHIRDQAFHLPDRTIKDGRGTDNSPVGQQ